MELQKILLKSVNEIIVPLFNKAFDSNVRAMDFELVGVSNNTTSSKGNTKAMLNIINVDSGYEGSREVYYDRKDATALFYGVKKFLPLAESELTPANVVAYLNSHYGLTCIAINHITSVTVTGDNVVVTFSAGSPIVTGSLQFTYYKDAVDLGTMLVVDELGGLSTPGVVEGVPNATYYSYAFDMTFAGTMMSGMNVGDIATSSLASVLASVSGDPWIIDYTLPTEYNLANAELVFTGTSAAADAAGHPANAKYTNVGIFKLTSLCTNFGGFLLVNMNG